jgi:hypothetical protein
MEIITDITFLWLKLLKFQMIICLYAGMTNKIMELIIILVKFMILLLKG